MRVQLKHILPLAVLLTGVVAKTTEDSTGTATEAASATDDSASATATDNSSATETGSNSSATGTSDNSSETGKKKTTAKATKTVSSETDTWVASIPSTTAPDLESTSGAGSRNPNYIIVSLSVGLLTAGMTFL